MNYPSNYPAGSDTPSAPWNAPDRIAAFCERCGKDLENDDDGDLIECLCCPHGKMAECEVCDPDD